MRLDICMPYWGRADHLMIAVESVLAQRDPRWTLTVIDDAYPDLTGGQWVADLPDERVTYRRNAENLGVTGTFNLAIEAGDANDVVIMGCDDVLGPEFVGTMLALREQFPTAAMLQPAVSVVDVDGAEHFPMADRIKARLRPRGDGPSLMEPETLATSLMKGNWLYFPAIVWKRSSLAQVGFDSNYGIVQDLHAIMSLAFAGQSLAVTPEKVFAYRRHNESVSSAAGVDGERFAEELQLFAWVAEQARQRGWRATDRAARRHITTRLHALATVPTAIRARNGRGLVTLLGQALRR